MACKNRNPFKKGGLAFSSFIVCSFSLEIFHRWVKEEGPAVSLEFYPKLWRVVRGKCGSLVFPRHLSHEWPVWH